MTDKTKTRLKNQSIYVILALLIVAMVCIAVAVSLSGAKRAQTVTTPAITTPKPTVTTPQQTTPPQDPPDNPANTEPQPLRFVLPVQGVLTAGHDEELLVFSNTMGDYRVHLGMDIHANLGTEVVCVADGVVKNVYTDPFMGVTVIVDHGDGLLSVYQNLSEVLAQDLAEGASLKAGDPIGCIGETALLELAEEPHLHFSMKSGEKWVDPADYVAYDPVQDTNQGYEDAPTEE